MPHDQLESLVLRLLGDKDHQKIFDAVTKVEKHYRQKSRDGVTMTPYDKGNRGRNPRDSASNRQVVTTVVILAILGSIVIKGKGIFLLWKRRMARLRL